MTFGVSSIIGLGGFDDPVGLCYSEGSISLVSFPQPPHRRECGPSYVSSSTRPLDSSGWLWPARVVVQKKILVYPSYYQSLAGRLS